MKSKAHKHFPSELRFDPVSKDWILIATGRANKPDNFARSKREKIVSPEKTCPFCHIEEEKIILEYKDKKGKRFVRIFPNDFPAFTPSKKLDVRSEGPYKIMQGVGFAEVVVTRDHVKPMAKFPIAEIRQVLEAFQERYLDLMNEKFVNYVSIFQNYGKEAGASIAHPHSQILTHPVIDPDLRRSLTASADHWRRYKKCPHCEMIKWDRKTGQRIIFENKHFIVVCPFASRVAFEIRIYPKEHRAYFERIKDAEKESLAQAFKQALSKLYKGLKDPAYNFFLHTAPSDGRNYDNYHWHFEILPKTSTWAGFELGTGIEISTIEPEVAAEFLRKQ